MTDALPTMLRAEVAAALARRFGAGAADFRSAPVAGGCISATAKLETATGDAAFLKHAPPGERVPGLFAAEAASLEALAAAGAVRVPAVLAVSDPAGAQSDAVVARGGDDGGGPAPGDRGTGRVAAWLLLEWLEPGRPVPGSWDRLGRSLAALHRTRARRYGWPRDNFIGPLPQANGESASWPAFWRERRLEPQLRRASRTGYFDAGARRRFDRLLGSLDALLNGAADDGASLLHGDLWGGNVHVLSNGEPALIDPSCSYGHREVDLAMTELFGGFDAAFYRAYVEAWPLDEAYAAVRRLIYQLYYLLVHVNLFGGGYVGRTLAALRDAGV